MRFSVSCTALGLTLVLGASGAQAQTVITTQPAPAVVTTAATVVQPAETTRTVTRRVLPAETTVVAPPGVAAPPVVAETVAAGPQPFYNVAPAADIYSAPAYDYAYRAAPYYYGYRAPAL